METDRMATLGAGGGCKAGGSDRGGCSGSDRFLNPAFLSPPEVSGLPEGTVCPGSLVVVVVVEEDAAWEAALCAPPDCG